MTAPSTFKFALACGVAGAWVDVTADVLFEEGDIPIREGRESQFDDIPPGTFSFTLANGDGKYTPGNPATTLATPLAEGMDADIELAGQLFSGTIRNLAVLFPAKELANKARVRVTVDDMLGNAGRHAFAGTVADALVLGCSPFLWWKLDDPVGTASASEVYGNTPITTPGALTTMTFGVTGPIDTATQVQIANAGGGSVSAALTSTIPYPTAASLGWWGIWITAGANAVLQVFFGGYPSGAGTSFLLGANADSGTLKARLYSALLSTEILGPALDSSLAYYYSVNITQVLAAGTVTLYGTPYLNGTAFSAPFVLATYSGALATNAQARPTLVLLSTASSTTASYSHLSLTSSGPVPFAGLRSTTATERIRALAFTTPEITLDTLPTMSPAILGQQDDGGSTLDALNEVIRAEQGYIWTETTGTLLAPVSKVKVAARNRERAIDYTFDVSEILDPIPFIHSLTNTLSQFTAAGPENSATYQDATLTPFVGSASSSESTLFRDYIDLYAYASDRVDRGINRDVVIQSITIDATSPRINRWTDLAAIRQGYRLHITGLPVTQLGYSTWDGIVIGRDITNTQDSQTEEPKTFFTFRLAPWSLSPVYGTARYAAGAGVLTLQSNITAGATSMSVVSTGPLLTTSGYPQNMNVGGEVVTVSAVSGAASPQTATISARGVGVLPAGARTAGAAIDIDPLPHYEF